MHNHQPNLSKLDPRAIKCLFLGYSSTQKGYKCYSPDDRKTYVTMDVNFFENQPYYPKPHILGENTQESGFWLSNNTIEPTFKSMSEILPAETNLPILSPEISDSPPNIDVREAQEDTTTNKELRVKERKPKKKKSLLHFLSNLKSPIRLTQVHQYISNSLKNCNWGVIYSFNI